MTFFFFFAIIKSVMKTVHLCVDFFFYLSKVCFRKPVELLSMLRFLLISSLPGLSALIIAKSDLCLKKMKTLCENALMQFVSKPRYIS